MKSIFLISVFLFGLKYSYAASENNENGVIYKNISWPQNMANIQPVQTRDTTLPYDAIMIDNLCINRFKDQNKNTHVFVIMDENGKDLFHFHIWYHPSHEYLRAYVVDKLIKNYIGDLEYGWFESLDLTISQNEVIGIGEQVGFQSPQTGTYIFDPERKALTLYIKDDYAFVIYSDSSNMVPEAMLKIINQWISTQKKQIPAKINIHEVERRQKLYEECVIQARKQKSRNTPLHTLKTWGELSKQEPRQFTRIFWDNANYGSGIEQLLKLEPLPYINTIPNVNTGVGCEPFLAELIQKGFQLTARKGGNYLMTATLKDKKTSIRYCIYHAFNPTEARQTLFAWNMYADERGTPRIVEKPGDFTMQAAIDNMNVRPGWVGDFDLCTKPRFNWEGALIEGSEKSAVYFMRGNTAAYFIADNPSYDVRPLARMLDEQLKKGLEQASKTSADKKE